MMRTIRVLVSFNILAFVVLFLEMVFVDCHGFVLYDKLPWVLKECDGINIA